ncbi:MAG TPA: vitamin B12 receptor [Bacteroidales bacterium]|nr:vitamin B12 receptor [Bacteroidales bacterium]
MLRKTKQKVSQPLTFRRWTRKSYAAFNSMGKTLRIGVLWMGCSILALPVAAQPGRDTLHLTQPVQEVELGEVVVSASRVPAVQSELMRVVQVVTRPEIERSVQAGIPSLLQTIRGVDVRTRGPMGIQSDIGIRGGTFDQTLILLNGINISDPQTGHHKMNLPVDLQSLDRIEVLLGPGARVFGPNAFNGAINFITPTPGEREFSRLNITFGDYGLFVTQASGSFKTGNLGHYYSLSNAVSDGYISNTDFNNLNMYYRGAINTELLTWDFQAGFNNKEFGANSFYTPRFPEQFEETQTRFASLQTRSRHYPQWSASAYWRQHRDRFELFRNEAPQWYAGHNYHRSDVAGASLAYTRTGNIGSTHAGLDFRYEHIFSNVLGTPLAMPKAVAGEYNAYFTRAYDRSHVNLFVEQNLYFGPLSISGGGLVYLSTGLKNRLDFFPGLDLGFQFTQNLRWYASANRTLRLPTFTDLFYRDPAHQGNPDLLPEEAITVETGFKGAWETLAFDVAGFYRQGTNLIDWVMSPGDNIWRSMNHTRVNISGVEAGLHFRPDFSLYFLNSPQISIQYSYLEARQLESEFLSRYVLEHLRHKLHINSSFKLGNSLDVNFSATYRDRNGGFMLFSEGAFTSMQEFEPFWLADLNLRFHVGNMRYSIGATNLFDTHFVSVANVKQPGRWLIAGFEWEF